MEAPYGSWKSPLTGEFVSSASKGLEGAAVDSQGRLLWLEGRPSEDGRSVLVRGGEDITPEDFNVRAVVHGCTGGSFALTKHGDTVVFSNFVDQRLYKQTLDDGDRSSPIALTPSYEGEQSMRYADGDYDAKFNRIIIVREVKKSTGEANSITEIVAVNLKGDRITEPTVLVRGNDFYGFPRLSPDGRKLAWMEWSHPNMPFDRSSIWVGEVSSDGDIVNPVCIAGGAADVVEAPSEPKWSPQGDLVFVSDRGNGFWNIYSWSNEEKTVRALHPLEAEFTIPLWDIGTSSFSFLGESGSQLICTYRQRGVSYLATLDLTSGTLSQIKTSFTDIYRLIAVGNTAYLIAGSAFDMRSLVKVSLTEDRRGAKEVSVIWSSLGIDAYKPYFSAPKVVEFPTKCGKTAYANFYLPKNRDFVGPAAERPPLLVRGHGGPTDEAKQTLSLELQYWTSRGWAIADVNYGGSSGYGREFRERIYGHWGIVDVNDCSSCAEYLVSIGEVDPNRLCIDGCSAGGYTAMASLVFNNTFKAGASLFGLSELSVFVSNSQSFNKFESRYVANLLGIQNIEQKIFERSPINHLNQLTCPLILFQGLVDKSVPREQARKMYNAVKKKGIPVALVEYEDEEHGFRKAGNIRNTLEQEMVFFARLIGGFQVADDITAIKVDNFDG